MNLEPLSWGNVANRAVVLLMQKRSTSSWIVFVFLQLFAAFKSAELGHWVEKPMEQDEFQILENLLWREQPSVRNFLLQLHLLFLFFSFSFDFFYVSTKPIWSPCLRLVDQWVVSILKLNCSCERFCWIENKRTYYMCALLLLFLRIKTQSKFNYLVSCLLPHLIALVIKMPMWLIELFLDYLFLGPSRDAIKGCFFDTSVLTLGKCVFQEIIMSALSLLSQSSNNGASCPIMDF